MILTKHSTLFYSFFILAVWVVFAWPSAASAYFWSSQTASAQQFQASQLTLDSIADPAEVFLSTMNATSSFSLLINTAADSAAAQHDVEVLNATGDETWCQSLMLEATAPSGNTYTATAGSFASNPEATFGSWQFIASSTDVSIPLGATCTIELQAAAWQVDLAKGTGYFDTESFAVTITKTEALGEAAIAPLSLSVETKSEEESEQQSAATPEEPVKPAPEEKKPTGPASEANDPAASREKPEEPTQEPAEPVDPATEESDTPPEPVPEVPPEPEEPVESSVDSSEEAKEPAESEEPKEPEEQEEEDELDGDVPESEPDSELENDTVEPEVAASEEPDTESTEPDDAKREDDTEEPADTSEPAPAKEPEQEPRNEPDHDDA